MTKHPSEPGTSHGVFTRRIVVHAALRDGVSRLFALSEPLARQAIDEVAGPEGGHAEGAWEIAEQEVDVADVTVKVVAAADGPELHWTCPACGASWHDPAGPDDEFPVLLLCDCDGTANTWCLGTRG